MRIQTEPFRKIRATTAAEVTARVELSADARAFLLPDLSPQAYLALLVEHALIGDAIRFLAFALPVREAVWWAVVVAWNGIEKPRPLESACLERAAAWVYNPDEALRRACFALAEEGKFEGAAAYAALAVFWSGGSLAPEGMPDAPADPSLGPIGAGASVLLAITAGDPLKLKPRFEAAVLRAINIANGGNGDLAGDRPPPVPN
jgi:hypothetical protein